MSRNVLKCSLLVTGGIVITMDRERQVLPIGWLAIDADRIVAVGAGSPDDATETIEAQRTIDATGCAVLPGFVNAHTHSTDLLLRGGPCDDRSLYDWLTNIVDPGCREMTIEDVTTAVQLYALEAVRGGITTVIDSVEAPLNAWDATAEAVVAAYAIAGMRAVYAVMFYDSIEPGHLAQVEALDQRPAEQRTDFGALMDLDAAMAGIERIMDRHHGTYDGRISVWPSPGVAVFCSAEAFRRARALAESRGVMSTVHVCESPVDAFQGGRSGIGHLEAVGYLSSSALAGHCVQLSADDVAIIARTGAKVASNPVSNAFLGSGVAPLPAMLDAGITVGLGTDDANCNGTVNMLADLKFAALIHKAHLATANAMTAEEVLELATIGGATAVGMDAEIGSLEVGKKADLQLIDLGHAHLTPRHSVASVLVYQALGHEVRTVIVNGTVVLDNRQVPWLDRAGEAELLRRAQATSERLVAAGRLPRRDDTTWRGAATRPARRGLNLAGPAAPR